MTSQVLHVGKFYPPHMGGMETHLQNLCRELAKTHRVEAIVANDGPGSVTEPDGPVLVHRAGVKATFASASFSPGLVSALRNCRADLLHLHLPNPTATLALLASGYRGPVVLTYHSDIVRQRVLGAIFDPFQQWILRRASAIICTSQRYLDTSPSLRNVKDKCIVIPYGIPQPRLTGSDSDLIAAIRARYGGRLVVSVGRLVYYKGYEYLLEAMRKVHGRLLIIGDGPLRRSLEQRAADAGLSDKVFFLGEIQNEALAPYYRAADVFAFPSVARSEAFGIVQLEAMACGLPVVNTDLDSGVPFVSRHNESGLTVPPRDPAALAYALNVLLADRSLAATFSQAARHRVRSEFSLELMARRTAALYADVLSNRISDAEFVPVPMVPLASALQSQESRAAS